MMAKTEVGSHYTINVNALSGKNYSAHKSLANMFV